MACEDGVSHGMDSNGMRAIAADLRNKSNCKINPATEDIVEDLIKITDNLRIITQTDIETTLMRMLGELKKMNLHLETITNERIQDKDVEV